MQLNLHTNADNLHFSCSAVKHSLARDADEMTMHKREPNQREKDWTVFGRELD